MKRFIPYVLAGLLGAAAGYFLAPRSDSALADLEACQAWLKVEQNATDRIAREADQRCDQRIDASLSQRKPCP